MVLANDIYIQTERAARHDLDSVGCNHAGEYQNHEHNANNESDDEGNEPALKIALGHLALRETYPNVGTAVADA